MLVSLAKAWHRNILRGFKTLSEDQTFLLKALCLSKVIVLGYPKRWKNPSNLSFFVGLRMTLILVKAGIFWVTTGQYIGS